MTTYWTVKRFPSREALMNFTSKNKGKIQWVEVFINNGFGVEYRQLRKLL